MFGLTLIIDFISIFYILFYSIQIKQNRGDADKTIKLLQLCAIVCAMLTVYQS